MSFRCIDEFLRDRCWLFNTWAVFAVEANLEFHADQGEGGRSIDRYFKLSENQTSVKQEILGGLTTFVTMAYIVVVNPQILAQAGMPAEGVVFATCLSAAAATLVMGLYANYPIALAPGMSLNAYFTYSVCLAMHVPWQNGAGGGVLFGRAVPDPYGDEVREQIVNGMPDRLKHSTAAGIGMFIAFVGLRNAKLLWPIPPRLLGRQFRGQGSANGLLRPCPDADSDGPEAPWSDPDRHYRNHSGGILRGISSWPTSLVALPHPSSTFLQLDFRGALRLGFLEILFAFLFVDLFDNVGTLVGVCEQAGFVKDGKIPRVGRVLLADSVGTIFGALTGTSTVTSYIESAAGVAAGARTGLSNVAVAALFLLAMLFSPLAAAIPAYATAPALILVGVLMSQSIAHVKWHDFTEALPAFITILVTPLAFSIATGLSFGVISYTVVKLAAGKVAEINTLVWILTGLFILRYVYLAAA